MCDVSHHDNPAGQARGECALTFGCPYTSRSESPAFQGLQMIVKMVCCSMKASQLRKGTSRDGYRVEPPSRSVKLVKSGLWSSRILVHRFRDRDIDAGSLNWSLFS